MSPGYDLGPSVSSVVPVFTLARTKASIEAAELSGIAARRIRPDRVSRYFARFRLGLAWLVPRSMTSTAPAIRIFPDFTGSKKLLSARNGISAWSTSTTPSSGSRCGSIIDRRSFCASSQAVLYVMPSWASSWTADMPFECVDMRCAAQNHTVSGNLDRCIAVPAVPTCPVEIRAGGEIWVKPVFGYTDPLEHWRQRLEDGLGHNLSLVIAKAVHGQLAAGPTPSAVGRPAALVR